MIFNRCASTVLVVFPALLWSLGTASQTSPTLGTFTGQKVALFQKLNTAAGSEEIKDVTFTGTVRRIAGSEDENGTAVLKALATGETEVDFDFPSGRRSEVHFNTENGPAGKWRGPDGIAHDIAPHNLLVDQTWFCPALLMRRLSQNSGIVASQDEQGRLSVSQRNVNSKFPATMRSLAQRASQIEIDIDPSTQLPSKFSFNTHPDNDLSRDIPVEIRFSDYRSVNGTQLPFHIQKYLNNSLILEMNFETAAVNTGISASSFNIQ